eukprot:m.54256 g.54256  ORF g.54256 m.54256 type:complete len:294 (+) comp10913_c0_seq2:178-1059(+)
MSMSVKPKQVKGLAELVGLYGTFIIDQWGVLHNGSSLYPKALEGMKKLRQEQGKVIIILSNSSKRVSDSIEKMNGMGITPDMYDHVVTSGELLYTNFQTKSDPVFKSLGKHFLPLAWDDDKITTLTSQSGYVSVDNVDEADFILCTGAEKGNLESYREILEKAQARSLPFLCGNPDLVSLQADGTLKICPGSIAKEYERLGGRVRWHGKPLKETYLHCLSLVGKEHIEKGVLCIGDSLEHDIKGSHTCAADSLFISSGIHGHEVGSPPDEDAVNSLSAKFGVNPTYYTEFFNW